MKTIKIVVGTYGHKKDNTSQIDLIGPGWGCSTDVCSVSDEEAARLIKSGVAVEIKETVVVEPAGAEETATGHLDAEALEEYTVSELKDLAKKLGLKTGGTKDELIKRISATEVEYPVAEEADDEEPPVLNPADPE